MTYDYFIFKPDSREEVGVRFSSTEPMHHIQVGHSLFVEHRDGDSIIDLDLVVERIEVSLFVSSGEASGVPQPQKMDVHIYTQKWNKHAQH